jgi:hypothetical protein
MAILAMAGATGDSISRIVDDNNRDTLIMSRKRPRNLAGGNGTGTDDGDDDDDAHDYNDDDVDDVDDEDSDDDGGDEEFLRSSTNTVEGSSAVIGPKSNGKKSKFSAKPFTKKQIHKSMVRLNQPQDLLDEIKSRTKHRGQIAKRQLLDAIYNKALESFDETGPFDSVNVIGDDKVFAQIGKNVASYFRVLKELGHSQAVRNEHASTKLMLTAAAGGGLNKGTLAKAFRGTGITRKLIRRAVSLRDALEVKARALHEDDDDNNNIDNVVGDDGEQFDDVDDDDDVGESGLVDAIAHSLSAVESGIVGQGHHGVGESTEAASHRGTGVHNMLGIPNMSPEGVTLIVNPISGATSHAHINLPSSSSSSSSSSVVAAGIDPMHSATATMNRGRISHLGTMTNHMGTMTSDIRAMAESLDMDIGDVPHSSLDMSTNPNNGGTGISNMNMQGINMGGMGVALLNMGVGMPGSGSGTMAINMGIPNIVGVVGIPGIGPPTDEAFLVGGVSGNPLVDGGQRDDDGREYGHGSAI